MDLFSFWFCLFILTIVPTGACVKSWFGSSMSPMFRCWKSLSGVVPRPWEKLLYRFLFSEVVWLSASSLKLFFLCCRAPESCCVTFSPDFDLDLPWLNFYLSGVFLLAKLGLSLFLSEALSSGCKYLFIFSKVCSFWGKCFIIYGYSTGWGRSLCDSCSGVKSLSNFNFRASAPYRYCWAIFLLAAKLLGSGKPGPSGLLFEPMVLLLWSDFDLEFPLWFSLRWLKFADKTSRSILDSLMNECSPALTDELSFLPPPVEFKPRTFWDRARFFKFKFWSRFWVRLAICLRSWLSLLPSSNLCFLAGCFRLTGSILDNYMKFYKLRPTLEPCCPESLRFNILLCSNI